MISERALLRMNGQETAGASVIVFRVAATDSATQHVPTKGNNLLYLSERPNGCSAAAVHPPCTPRVCVHVKNKIGLHFSCCSIVGLLLPAAAAAGDPPAIIDETTTTTADSGERQHTTWNRCVSINRIALGELNRAKKEKRRRNLKTPQLIGKLKAIKIGLNAIIHLFGIPPKSLVIPSLDHPVVVSPKSYLQSVRLINFYKKDIRGRSSAAAIPVCHSLLVVLVLEVLDVVLF